MIGAMTGVSTLAGCGEPLNSVPRATATTTLLATPGPTVTAVAGAQTVCADGRLLIRDLPQMDLDWRIGIEAATKKALDWQADARLTRLRVGCQLFESGFRWQATFYSDKAQTFYTTDTDETAPAEVAPSAVPTLPTDSISFGLLRRSLAKSGYDDSDVISPSTGVDLRMSTAAMPYGPPTVPMNVLIYHVAVERSGETKDIFVDGKDGTTYRYPAP
jgi:hypothetical protein